MWQVDNRTPFAAERGWLRDRDGAEIWVVAVKATFDIRPDGTTEIAKEQPAVLRLPEHFGEPGKSSIKYDADLVLTKKTTDVIVVGHAYPPAGATVTHADVGFKVGPVQKVLRVFGDRRWRAMGMSAPEPFEKMPIIYERAYGGTDLASKTPEKDWEWRNPVGAGFATSGSHANGLALPNIEDPKRLIGSWSDRPAPAGFGVVASHWQPRVGFAGTYDDHWMKTRQPLLAEDLDDRYFQCAPADQQAPEFLRGGEPAVLLKLTPGGELRFTLPKLHLGFETRFYDGGRQVHQNRRLHTVILEPDFPRVSLVWHSALPCHFKVQKLERTVVTLKTDLSTGAPRAERINFELA
ncbi:DUF2169 family type VI secretion system accessory protein [Roseateles sp.]|uniref:DUF2169 family type VI secretion system accessory protein n=1 Tax=Roseateles sp. TaxID=1971397 RepID=UPI0039EB1422